jgi:hypothetical protein
VTGNPSIHLPCARHEAPTERDRPRAIAWRLPLAVALLAILAVPARQDALAAERPSPSTGHVAVICPEAFRPALKPWIEHRRGQGYTIELLSNAGTPDDIRDRLLAARSRRPFQAVVLVGDAGPRVDADGRPRLEVTPTRHSAARVNVRFGSEPDIPDDNWYADLDDDGIPDVALGRLTADTPDELRTIVRKTLDYERRASYGDWVQRVNFVAGVGGFGALADAALEQWARQLITDRVPAAYSTSMTYSSWRSPYCPGGQCFRDETLARLNEGCLFWVYLGHALPGRLATVRVPGGQYPILSTDDVCELNNQHGAPIAVFLSCYTGAFDARQDCLAEELLRAPGAPVAIVCGSRVTMPYAMSVLGTQLLAQCFQQRRATLGEMLLHAKRNMVLAARDDADSRDLDAMAKAMNPESGDLAEERAEHLALFNLLGDPLLRIPQPRDVAIDVPESVASGGRLSIAGRSEVDGPCTIELVVRRDRMTFKPPKRNAYDDDPVQLAEYREVYRKANDPRWTSVSARVTDGVFRAVLDVPDEAHGDCHVRVFVTGDGEFGLGAVDLRVERAPRQARRIQAPQPDRAGR